MHNEVFREAANACSAALIAFILLLVLGTQILGWSWALLLPAGAAGLAVWRIRKRVPSFYATAQRIDSRMNLADCLSTATFFTSADPASLVSPEMRRLQMAQAEQEAARVDLRQAIPYAIPQTAYIAAALLLVASSVFALRYGLTDRLDLKQPLARIVQQRLGWEGREERAKADTRKNPDKIPLDDFDSADGRETSSTEPNQQPDDLANSDAPAQSPQNQARGDKKNPGDKSQADADKADEEGQADQSEDPNSEGKQSASNQKEGQKNGNNSQSGSNSDSRNPSNQSLMSKMKEAMQNLLSSLQQSPDQQQQQQSASNQNGKSGKNQNKQGNKGEKKNGQQADSQEQQTADDGEQAQNAQGQSAEKADSPLANKQPGSGAGNKDGSKDVKQAEQVAAMGKISEIIGKRSAHVTGEITVDVQNTSQQLRTSYQERRAEHTQAGAEINRDEIPVALENYVEQYFEQVRKAPSKP
ncbi:MAG: hypothetical protein C5B51_23605 [Terriglobia bacterium]|nr:MAG: hypothetical protein C5B51_23605 [Terriglobia bacterium]